MTYSAFAAFLWDVAPRVTTGVEFMVGGRETVGGAEGDLSRFTFSTKFAY